MGNKSAFELYKNGKSTLMGISAVTAVNVLLALCGFDLFFPFSAALPREIIARSRGTDYYALASFGAIVLLVGFVVLCILSLTNDKFPAMRCGWVLYAIDSLMFFALALPAISVKGFTIAYVIELVFRWFILSTLYKADRVFYDPKRKNPNAVPKNNKKKKAAPPPPPEDEEEDEGIQW